LRNDETEGCARLAAFLPGAPIYAMLDGARDSRIRRFVRDSRAPAWCLWRGQVRPEVEDLAPYLLRLEARHEYTCRFFELSSGNSWGVLLASKAPSRDLRRHLRKFLRVQTEEGRVLLFRYYDPRVLRVFLPALPRKEAARFFGPIEAFAADSDIFRRDR
jgi:hypothetical protein